MDANATIQSSRWVTGFSEVGDHLGVSAAQSRRIARTVGFPEAYQWTDGGTFRWDRDELDRWMRSRKVRPVLIDTTPSPVTDRRRKKRAA